MTISTLMRRFVRGTDGGATAIAVAVVTVMTVGGAALITDNVRLVSQRDTLKTASEAAGVAATLEMARLLDHDPGISDSQLTDELLKVRHSGDGSAPRAPASRTRSSIRPYGRAQAGRARRRSFARPQLGRATSRAGCCARPCSLRASFSSGTRSATHATTRIGRFAAAAQPLRQALPASRASVPAQQCMTSRNRRAMVSELADANVGAARRHASGAPRHRLCESSAVTRRSPSFDACPVLARGEFARRVETSPLHPIANHP